MGDTDCHPFSVRCYCCRPIVAYSGSLFIAHVIPLLELRSTLNNDVNGEGHCYLFRTTAIVAGLLVDTQDPYSQPESCIDLNTLYIEYCSKVERH